MRKLRYFELARGGDSIPVRPKNCLVCLIVHVALDRLQLTVVLIAATASQAFVHAFVALDGVLGRASISLAHLSASGDAMDSAADAYGVTREVRRAEVRSAQDE